MACSHKPLSISNHPWHSTSSKPHTVMTMRPEHGVFCCVLQPEPFEFLKDKQQQVLQRVASTAAQRVARSFSRQHSSLGGVGSLTRRSSTARALSALRLSSLSPSTTQQAPSGAAADHHGPMSPQASSGGECLRQLSARQLSLQLQRSVSITADGRLVRDAVGGKQQQQDVLDKAWPELAGCEQEFHHEVCAAGWRGAWYKLLQCCGGFGSLHNCLQGHQLAW